MAAAAPEFQFRKGLEAATQLEEVSKSRMWIALYPGLRKCQLSISKNASAMEIRKESYCLGKHTPQAPPPLDSRIRKLLGFGFP